MTCPACQHAHIGAMVCGFSTGRDNVCVCGTVETDGPTTGEGDNAMSEKNVETVEGKNPKQKAMEALGFRVSRVTVKETEDGGKSGDATVVGAGFAHGAELIGAIGEGVELRSAGDRRQRAVLRSITFKAATKDGKPGTTTMKVTGAAELDETIGAQVKVKPLQMILPRG